MTVLSFLESSLQDLKFGDQWQRFNFDSLEFSFTFINIKTNLLNDAEFTRLHSFRIIQDGSVLGLFTAGAAETYLLLFSRLGHHSLIGV